MPKNFSLTDFKIMQKVGITCFRKRNKYSIFIYSTNIYKASTVQALSNTVRITSQNDTDPSLLELSLIKN